MTNTQKNLIINNETILTEKNYETITLIEEGCIKLQTSPDFKEITINRLINKKTNPLKYSFDFLITTKNEKDVQHNSSLKNEDGKDGGKFTINVKDLIHDVKVCIIGRENGACGTSSTTPSKEEGYGVHVTFNYGNISSIPGKPYIDEKNSNDGLCGTNRIIGTFTKHQIESYETRYKKPLNLNKEEEYNYFLEHFGGKETLKKYPKIWNSIQKAACENKTDDNEQRFINQSYVEIIPTTSKQKCNNIKEEDICSNTYKFNIHLNMKLINNTFSNDTSNKHIPTDAIVEVNIINQDDPKDKYPIYFEHIDEEPYNISRNQESTSSIPTSRLTNKRWILEEKYMYGYENKSPEAIICHHEINMIPKPCFDHIEIIEPNFHGTNKKTQYIKFLYGRGINQNKGEFEGDADYYGGPYFKNQMPDTKHPSLSYIPTTIIPIKGKIFFAKNSKFKINSKDDIVVLPYTEERIKPELFYSEERTEEQTKFISKLVSMDKDNKFEDPVNGKTLANQFDIQTSMNDPSNDNQPSITFDLTIDKSSEYGPYDWHSQIKDASFHKDNYACNNCELTGRIYFQITCTEIDNPMNTLTYKIPVVIQGRPNNYYRNDNGNFQGESQSTTVYIPRLQIWWGCYAADTLITTTKGRKKACEIIRGDKLPTYSGKILTVSEVIIGDEKWICNIKTTDNKSIRVSSGHAMKLYCENKPDGRKISAVNIKKGDILMTPEGNVEVASVEKEAYNDKVYNFEFMENAVPNYIVANGFWSGDFVAQNEPEKRELTPEQKSICAEWKQLAAELIQKRKEESSST